MKTKSLMLFGAIAGLVSACGGSDTSVLPFFVEAESAGAARNGLSFATESTPADFTQVGPGDSFKIRFVGTRKAQQVGMPEFLTSVETLTLTEKPSGLFRYDGLMTYRGETFSMDIGPSGDVFDGFGTLSDGRYYNMELGTGAAHSGSMFVTFGANTLEEYSIAARGNFVIGFETDPDVLPDLTGTATFNGEFLGKGFNTQPDGRFVTINDETYLGDTHSYGTMTLNVDFDSLTISGGIEGEVGLTGVTGYIPVTEIQDGTFYTPISMTCEDMSNCQSSSVLGGSFFGPNAEEASGLIYFDVDGFSDVADQEISYQGTAGFTVE